MVWTFIQRCLIVIFVVVLAGCTIVGPDFEGVGPVALPSEWQQRQSTNAEYDLKNWWQQFNDPTLNALVITAIEQNLDIESAGLRILQARMVLGISEGWQYPQVQKLSGSFARGYNNEKGSRSGLISFDAGWEIDIWGKYARGIESSEAGLYASIASYHDISVIITSEVARNYINYRTFQERVLLSERNIEIQKRVVDITQVQFDSGNVTELDVQQAKSQLYSTQAVLPSLKIGMIQAHNGLAVLLGLLPDALTPMLNPPELTAKIAKYKQQYSQSGTKQPMDKSQSSSLVPRSPEVVNSIDADLVLRRPDLQIAELSAHLQSARIGIAESALYPNFSLFGSIGINSTVPNGSSFSFSDSLVLAAGPSFSWNLFQYGRIKNNVRLEDARLQEALVQYNKKLLQAISEVSSALSGYGLLKEQQGLRLSSVNTSIRAFNISMTQYENGQIGFERLLNSVDKMTRSEDSYAQVKGNVANQVVALYKSLGGGWQANSGKAFISNANIEQMKQRSDWDDILDEPSSLPSRKAIPTGEGN